MEYIFICMNSYTICEWNINDVRFFGIDALIHYNSFDMKIGRSVGRFVGLAVLYNIYVWIVQGFRFSENVGMLLPFDIHSFRRLISIKQTEQKASGKESGRKRERERDWIKRTHHFNNRSLSHSIFALFCFGLVWLLFLFGKYLWRVIVRPSCQTKFFPSFCCHYSSWFSLISTHTTLIRLGWTP